jgi:ankyrin repeat protein
MLLSVSQVHQISCTIDTKQEISSSIDLVNNDSVDKIPEHILLKQKLLSKLANNKHLCARCQHYPPVSLLDINKAAATGQVSFSFYWDNKWKESDFISNCSIKVSTGPLSGRILFVNVRYNSFLKWDLELLELVVRNKADINIQSSPEKQTLLMEFVRHNKFEHVKYLLSLENIDISLKNKQGQTALDIAVTNDNQEIIELFQNYFEMQATKTSK